MHVASLGIAHAYRIVRHLCEVSPMHFALSGIAHAYRIIGHQYMRYLCSILCRPCISHYRHLYGVSESPMHFALSGFDISCMRCPCGILDRPCILHFMHIALSGMRYPCGILDCPCISHYQASPMHIALSGIAHAHCIIGHTTSSLLYSSPVKKGIEWYRMV
jgi:hypothetical protein